MKNIIVNSIIGLIILAGIYVGLYPVISNYYWQINQTSTISTYNNSLKQLSDNNIIEQQQKAIEYNNNLYNKYKDTIFMYQGENKTDPEYESILNTSSIMGYIEIPKLNIYLPITHGTKASDLDSMVGHIYQSSIPVGGNNTHAILSAHTGLAQSRLFTDIDELTNGDEFYIYVLNKKLCYRVVDINVCTPEEDYHYMQIEKNKDLVSLYTCTPYGINDHRLIVKGEHDITKDSIIELENDNLEVQNKNKWANILYFVLLIGPGLIYFIFLGILIKKSI